MEFSDCSSAMTGSLGTPAELTQQVGAFLVQLLRIVEVPDRPAHVGNQPVDLARFRRTPRSCGRDFKKVPV